MFFKLPVLPFDSNRLSGWLSPETIDFHYGKHHRGYVEKLNALLPGSGMEKASLEEIVMRAEGALLDNAAQAWNHTFYWHGISATPKSAQYKDVLTNFPVLAKAIRESFGSLEKLEREFASAALGLFGSGWAWLVLNEKTGKLEITQTSNAGNPIRQGLRPLLTCDVWEHAYYIDFRNARTKYVDGFLMAIDWAFVDRNLSQSHVFDATTLMRPSNETASHRVAV